MPVAVLSSLTLGLAVDFAIHFLARSRALYEKYGSWEACHDHVFGEPARAITRNVIVIAVGFTPLLFAPLVPYITVGVFLASILFVSGLATLLILPALIRLLEPWLFPKTAQCALLCQFGTTFVAAITAIALIAVNVHQFMEIGYGPLAIVCGAAAVLAGGASWLLARRSSCEGVEP